MTTRWTHLDGSPVHAAAIGRRAPLGAARVIDALLGRAASSAAALVVIGAGIVVAQARQESFLPGLVVLPLAVLGLALLQLQTVACGLRDGRWMPVAACAVGSPLWVTAVCTAVTASDIALRSGLAASAALVLAVAAMPSRTGEPPPTTHTPLDG